jgi:hypothetical protein
VPTNWVYRALNHSPGWSARFADFAFMLLLAALPAAFVGAIVGRQALGILCGLASGLAVAAFHQFG